MKDSDQEKKVLVVNDEPAILILIEEFLRYLGYSAIAESGGLCALARLGTMSEDDRLPHVIVTDINMPEMDGFQFIAQLFENERLARIPVVVASANDHSEELMRRFGRPFPICSFPFSPEKIAEIFREHRL